MFFLFLLCSHMGYVNETSDLTFTYNIIIISLLYNVITNWLQQAFICIMSWQMQKYTVTERLHINYCYNIIINIQWMCVIF